MPLPVYSLTVATVSAKSNRCSLLYKAKLNKNLLTIPNDGITKRIMSVGGFNDRTSYNENSHPLLPFDSSSKVSMLYLFQGMCLFSYIPKKPKLEATGQKGSLNPFSLTFYYINRHGGCLMLTRPHHHHQSMVHRGLSKASGFVLVYMSLFNYLFKWI